MKQPMGPWMIIAFTVCLVMGVSASHADANTTISGLGPFVITNNTQLVGDVDCSTLSAGACITFAAPHLQLDLNGFTITGPKPAFCFDPFGPDGIDTNGQGKAQIEGPGKVQQFRVGIQVNGSNKSQVQRIVAIRNCLTGIIVVANQVEITENIVLNTNPLNPATPHGGISINGNNNVVRDNEVHGHFGGVFPGYGFRC